jgi:hypothetical protein
MRTPLCFKMAHLQDLTFFGRVNTGIRVGDRLTTPWERCNEWIHCWLDFRYCASTLDDGPAGTRSDDE